MSSLNSHWGFNSNNEFGNSARHALGDRDVGVCRPDSNSPGNCCGCVRKGEYPCEYQTIGGEPPAAIEKCFRDPADWDDDGTTCLSKDSAKCCPLPDFSPGEHQSKWAPSTSEHFSEAEQTQRETYWNTNTDQTRSTCYPSVEGGMCKYEDENGLSLFYNFVDGNYLDENNEPKNTLEERNKGNNVHRLVNYPKLVAEKAGRDPPEAINLCNRDKWDEANILFHQMTTEAGREYYIDDLDERRRRQRIDSIGRISQTYDSDIGGYRTGSRMMTAEDFIGDELSMRFGPASLSSVSGRGGLLSDIEPRWNEDQPKDGSLDFESDRDSTLEDITERGVLYGFIVPDNTLPGDRIKVRIRTGQLVQFTIPDNAGPGQNIKFRVNE